MIGAHFCPNQRFPIGGWTRGPPCLSVCLAPVVANAAVILVEVSGKEAKVEGFSESTEPPPPLLPCQPSWATWGGRPGTKRVRFRPGALFLTAVLFLLLCFLLLQGDHQGETCDFGVWALSWEEKNGPGSVPRWAL